MNLINEVEVEYDMQIHGIISDEKTIKIIQKSYDQIPNDMPSISLNICYLDIINNILGEFISLTLIKTLFKKAQKAWEIEIKELMTMKQITLEPKMYQTIKERFPSFFNDSQCIFIIFYSIFFL